VIHGVRPRRDELLAAGTTTPFDVLELVKASLVSV
jgi:hypothetical protein